VTAHSKLLRMLAVVALFALVAACGGEEEGAEPTPQFQAESLLILVRLPAKGLGFAGSARISWAAGTSRREGKG